MTGHASLPGAGRSLRICYFGTYYATYPRNRLMIEGLRRNGAVVEECHYPLWGNEVQERIDTVQGGWMQLAFWLRLCRAYLHLAVRLSRAPRFDVMMVGYPGLLDVFAARLFTMLRRRPLIWDVLMSVGLISRERRLHLKNSLSVRLLAWIERLACRIPDQLVIDTLDYALWFEREYGIPRERFLLIPLGADDHFSGIAPTEDAADAPMRVLYYGSVPNHGVPLIVEAARLLSGEGGVEFTLIGRSADLEEAARRASALGLTCIRFLPRVPFEELLREISRADVCLGSFTNLPQGLITVQNKVIECLAASKVVVTGSSPAALRLLRHRENVWLVRRENAHDLAEALRTLRSDPALRRVIAQNARIVYRREFAPERTVKTLLDHLIQSRR